MKRILFITLLVSAVSMNALIDDIIEETTDTAADVVEGAAYTAERAVVGAGNIAAAPFRARHYDDRNGRYFYVTNGGGREYIDSTDDVVIID
jgi:hypothetical protein